MKRISGTRKLADPHRFSGEQIYRRDLLNLVPRFVRILTGIGLVEVLGSCTGAFRSSLVGSRVRYPLTVSALQELYADEFRSRLTYLAYSEKALSDNYPAIAHLFAALAASDLVHLRNFTASLIDLGLEPKKSPPPRIQYLNTKENLNKALEMEITKIDQYPRFLDRIKGERHKETIRRIWYAVESEKKHSAYIRRIQNHAGLRFQFLAKYMETRPVRYYVCRECGYTVIKLPHKACPVCERPVDYYKEVEMADLST